MTPLLRIKSRNSSLVVGALIPFLFIEEQERRSFLFNALVKPNSKAVPVLFPLSPPRRGVGARGKLNH